MIFVSKNNVIENIIILYIGSNADEAEVGGGNECDVRMDISTNLGKKWVDLRLILIFVLFLIYTFTLLV